MKIHVQAADNRKLKIGCLQAEGVPGDIAHNLAEIDRAAARARADGVELLITPEMFVTGYDCGPLEPVLSQWQDLQRSVAEIAIRHRIALLVGVPRDLPDGSITNSAIFIDESGRLLGEHAKSHFYRAMDEDLFTPGEKATTIIDYRGVRIAILICMELEYPELARLAALEGADLIAVLTANMAPYSAVNDHLVWTRAWENQVYVAYVNRCGKERETHYVGLSSVYGPDAELLAGADENPALLVVDIDPRAVSAARSALNDYLGERRPDMYSGLTRSKSFIPTEGSC